jgi:hypothetical protein
MLKNLLNADVLLTTYQIVQSPTTFLFEMIIYTCYGIIGQLVTACYWTYSFQVNLTQILV